VLPFGAGAAQAAQATPPPSPQAAAMPQPGATVPASPSASPVQVTGVDVQQGNGSVIVHIATAPDASWDWHRLRPPDNRFWIDIHNARVTVAPVSQAVTGPITSVRAHQDDPDTVRVALSLQNFYVVDVKPDSSGISITVNQLMADDSAPREGSSANAIGAWKFSPRPGESEYVATNPKLIVIDPGHGGADDGSMHDGLVEKDLNLDIAKRLRDILVSRGWQVIMTRTDDQDVGNVGDSDADMLQARDDIANQNGARLFVSVHGNAFVNSGPHGATVYYYKPSDLALAQAVDARIGAEMQLKNDGIVKDKLYVIHHAEMPATLVETAYLTNPDDRMLLQSPQWRQQMAQAIADGIGDYAGDP
jgi:N-acetylmuramoyl-L-alanine amidase CwlD